MICARNVEPLAMFGQGRQTLQKVGRTGRRVLEMAPHPRRTGDALALTRAPVSPSAVTTASASRLILSRLPAYRPAGVLFSPRPSWRGGAGLERGHAARGQGSSGGRLVRRAGRHRRPRFRRALSTPLRHDRRRRPRLPARSAGGRDASRRRRPQTRGRPRGRSGRRARTARRNPRPRRACADARRLASRQPPPLRRAHAEGSAHPPRSGHRGHGQGLGHPGCLGRGAVQSGRRRLCARRTRPRSGAPARPSGRSCPRPRSRAGRCPSRS